MGMWHLCDIPSLFVVFICSYLFFCIVCICFSLPEHRVLKIAFVIVLYLSAVVHCPVYTLYGPTVSYIKKKLKWNQ